MELMIADDGAKYYTDGRKEISCSDVYGFCHKSFLKDFIPYLEAKPDSEWIDIIFANKDTSKRCVIYHFLGFVGQDYPSAKNAKNLDWFDGVVTPILMISNGINDGKDKRYSQETPKARVIAYLKNLLDGKELTTHEMIEKFLQERFGAEE